MNKKTSPIGNKVAESEQSRINDFREFAETMRAAATMLRHAVNVALNVPQTDVLPDKDSYEKFLSSLDYLQGMLFKYYNSYSKCASNLDSAQKKSAESAAN